MKSIHTRGGRERSYRRRSSTTHRRSMAGVVQAVARIRYEGTRATRCAQHSMRWGSALCYIWMRTKALRRMGEEEGRLSCVVQAIRVRCDGGKRSGSELI